MIRIAPSGGQESRGKVHKLGLEPRPQSHKLWHRFPLPNLLSLAGWFTLYRAFGLEQLPDPYDRLGRNRGAALLALEDIVKLASNMLQAATSRMSRGALAAPRS